MKPQAIVPSHPRTLLRRLDTSPEKTEAFAGKNSVKYAAEKLGYYHPSKLKEHASNALGKALRNAGIVPFDPQTVLDYKAECILRKQGGHSNWLAAKIAHYVVGDTDWNQLNVAVMVASSIAAVIGLGLTIAGFITPFNLGWPLGMLVTGSIFLYLSLHVRFLSREWAWKEVSLNGYTGEVPQFALDIAKEIHMRAPRTEFYIDQLVRTTTQRVVDPFLVAVNKEDRSQRYYVEVWDEPSFDQKRMV